MSYLYTHLPQDEYIGFEERSYKAHENILEYNSRQVLYLYTEAAAVSFCDRSYACHLGSVTVKGYVLGWKSAVDPNGSPLSEIEPVTDDGEKQGISEALRSIYAVPSVNFF